MEGYLKKAIILANSFNNNLKAIKNFLNLLKKNLKKMPLY